MRSFDRDTWARIFPFLNESHDIPSDQLETWLTRVSADHPDIGGPLRAALTLRFNENAESEFLERPFAFVPPRPSLIGDRVGAYTIESLLGRGGMGEVWLARRSDGHFKGQFAVKFLDPASHAPAALDRFKREGRLLARLAHPNIARLIDAGVLPDGRPYLILEYVKGEQIDLFCDARSLGVEARVRLLLRVAAVVAHAHTNLVVHRDIKPSNVLVTPDGEVKLLDFGVAKLLANDLTDEDRSDATRIEDIAFTPDYAAPEQILGDIPSTATDVYQLGVLLYVLLVGRVPLPGATQTRGERLRLTLQEIPPLLSEVAPVGDRSALRGDLDAIAAKALSKRPEDRYSTAAALAADLNRYLDHEPIRAREGVFAYRARKFIRRYRAPVVGTTVAVLALLAATAFSLVQMREANRQRDQARYQQKRAEAESGFLGQIMSTVSADGRPVTPAQIIDGSMAMLNSQYDNDPSFRLSMMILVAERFMDYGNGQKSYAALKQAEVLAGQLNDFAAIARIECDAVNSGISVGDTVGAVASLDRGLQALARVPNADTVDRARCMDGQASVMVLQGALPDAIATVLQAMSLLERSGRSRTPMYTDLLSHISVLYHDAGDTKKAFQYNSLESAALTGMGQSNTQAGLSSRHNIATGLLNFGEVASSYAEEQQTIARARSATSDGIIEPSISDLYGNLQVRLNEPLAAVSSYDDAIAAARTGQDVESELYAHVGRADALIEAGRLDEVCTELRLVSELANGKELHYRRPLARAAIVATKLLLAQNHLDEARRKSDTLLLELRESNAGGMGYLGLALSLSSRIALAEHRFADAERAAAETLVVFEKRARDPAASADVGESLLLLAKAQAGQGQVTAAAETANRAAVSLEKGLGRSHPLTVEATALAAPQRMNKPPLISHVAPVTKPASRAQRREAMLATNAGSPSAPVGMPAMSCAMRSAGTVRCTIGVSSGPGAMALTVMPNAARSRAKTLVRVSMAPFDAA